MLNDREKIRKNELLERYKLYSTLAPTEIQELRDLIGRDEEENQGAKLLMLLALGVLLGYLLSKK